LGTPWATQQRIDLTSLLKIDLTSLLKIGCLRKNQRKASAKRVTEGR